MPLDQLLKLLSAAKFPLAVTVCGLALNFGGSNIFLKNTGLNISLLAAGTAAAAVVKRNGQLSEIRQLEAQHSRQTAALNASVQSALNDAATAKQAAQTQAALVEQSKGAAALLQTNIQSLKAERDRMKEEVLSLSQLANATSANLAVCGDDKSVLAGQLESLQIERMQLIYELYETAVTEADLNNAIAGMESQFQNDVTYQLTQKKKLKSEVTKARANFHTEISEAQERIAELEAALDEKSKQAVAIVDDLSADANGKFSHFSGKANAQGEIINGLRVQIEELRKTNNALTYRRFDTVGTDNIVGNRLIDYLAKQGLMYGALDLSRDGYKGRLKVWLTLIDTTLDKANKSLEDMETALNLKLKPTVEISRGMHLFTLATEPEYETEKVSTMRPPEELIRILKEVNHLRVSAPTDSGKSTLMSNILYLLNVMYKGAQTTTLYDPKYPDSDWPIKPTYNEVEQCVLNAGFVGDTVKARLDEARKAAENSTQPPQHDPHLFVVDEIEFMYSEALAMADMGGELKNTVKTFKRSMKRGLKVGRSRNLKLLYVMQSHLCSDAGFNTADFLQSTNIFLGSNIPMVLATDGELKGRFSDDKRRKLLSEFQSLSAKGERYIMLVVTANSREAFIMIPPKPNYFADKDGATLKPEETELKAQVPDSNSAAATASDKPKCRYCESENVTYRRQKGGKKQYTCNEPASLCSKKTFTI